MGAMKSCSIHHHVATLVIVLLFNLCCFGKAADRQEEGLGASFIFGDSLVDAGNNNFLSTLSKANIPPNGIDFKASKGTPTGRYTNGRTIGDIIGEELGSPNYAVPFLSPNSTGKAILYGVNYASGGGGIMNATGRIFVNRLGMDVQIDYFNITRKQFDKLLGPSKARDYIMKKSIFSVTIGANDFLNNYLLPVLSIGARISQTPDAFIDDMLSHLSTQLTRLYQLDARKFVIGNVGPIGCIPYQKTINQLKEDECVELPNKLALQYNARLKDLLAQLNENLPGALFVHANVYDLVLDLITNYKQHVCRNNSVRANIEYVRGAIQACVLGSLSSERGCQPYYRQEIAVWRHQSHLSHES
ncbi:hypothetical protein I3843_01G023700 [Carya illinoinensis]|nr:hypothetical protein I3843_01G023700 [Carya illinoinensis]